MTLAFVFVECEEGQATAVKKSTSKIRGVQETHSISDSDFDLVVKVDTKDEQSLHSVLGAVRHVSGIAAVATSIVCRSLH
jgi:DNA-binding Lrp family transcriptional regulator